MTAKSAFVTGARGFLGMNLIEQLTDAEWQVTALHRRTSDLRHIECFPVRLVEGDLLNVASLRRAILQAVDVVFGVAADTSVWSRYNARQTRTNVEVNIRPTHIEPLNIQMLRRNENCSH